MKEPVVVRHHVLLKAIPEIKVKEVHLVAAMEVLEIKMEILEIKLQAKAAVVQDQLPEAVNPAVQEIKKAAVKSKVSLLVHNSNKR